MTSGNYILDILRTLYPSIQISLKGDNLRDPDPLKRCLVFGIYLKDVTTNLEFELLVFYSKITIISVRPYKGLVSNGPFITHAEDPINNGFMDGVGNLTQKGSYYLFRILKDVLNIHRLVMDRPNAILEIYATCYTAMLETDPSIIFGHIMLHPDTNPSLALGKLVKHRYGFEVQWPVDLFFSFQNIVKNHPDLFRGELN